MNFFCSCAELDQYIEGMDLNHELVIKADIDRALEEAIKTFGIEDAKEGE